nr:KGK domain-containing protein [Phormidium tenue]
MSLERLYRNSRQGLTVENKRIVLADEEVILLNNTENDFRSSFSLPRTFRIDDLKARFIHRSSKTSIFDWVEVEVMRLGKGDWQKGKMRIECVFMPDEEERNPQNPEDNPLDELRTKISKFDEQNK